MQRIPAVHWPNTFSMQTQNLLTFSFLPCTLAHMEETKHQYKEKFCSDPGLEIGGCLGRDLTKLNFASRHPYLTHLDASLRNFFNFLKVTVCNITHQLISPLLPLPCLSFIVSSQYYSRCWSSEVLKFDPVNTGGMFWSRVKECFIYICIIYLFN